MKTRRGWVQGYNAQAVLTTGRIILAADVATEADDVHQLTGMLDQAQANVEAVPGAAVADAGYRSEANAAVEPVFGQMKDRQGADRFSMRGLERCRGEWQIDAAVHNLRKLHRESVRRAENGRNGEEKGRKAA